MLRYYFAFLLVVGIASSMLTGRHSEPPASAVRNGDERATPLGSLDSSQGPDAERIAQEMTGNALTLKRELDGHFYAEPQINGTTIRMLVDTGATGIALSRDDARRAGIGISIGMPDVVGKGAGGDVHGEMVMLDRVDLGGESAKGMPAIVLDGGDQSLLGQSFLSKFASIEIHDDTMILR
jgi:aspartyl protease family protein